MAASNALQVLDNMVREDLPGMSVDTLYLVDPIVSAFVPTTEDVVSEISRGWNVTHRFHSGVAGLYEPATTGGGTIYTSALRTDVRNTPVGFPNPAETPHINSFLRQVFLRGHKGNYAVELGDLKVESLNNAVMEKWANDLKGVAKLLAVTEMASFYMDSWIGIAPGTSPQVTGGKITTTMTSPGGTSTAFGSLKIYPASSRMAYYRSGQYLDFFDNSSLTNRRNMLNDGTTDVPMIVDIVDPVGTGNGPFIVVTCVSGRDLSSGIYYNNEPIIDAATDNYIVPRGGTSTLKTGHYGLNDWVKNTGTLFGDADVWDPSRNVKATTLDLDDYPEFKSIITTNLASPLSETVLNQQIGIFVEAFQSQLDTILTTQGVTLKMLETPFSGTNRLNYDRTGKSLQAKFGFQPLTYEYEGRSLSWNVSPFMPIGTLYAIKTGEGNIKRYVPPRLKPQVGLSTTGTMETVSGEIEFINAITNDGKVFGPVYNSDGEVVAQVQAPFWQFSNIAPTDVRSVKIAGITETDLKTKAF